MSMVQKAMTGVLVFSLLLGGTAKASIPSGVNSIYMDGNDLDFGKFATIADGSTMVPMRGIFERLGFEVNWNNQEQIIHAVRDGQEINLQIGRTTAQLNKTTTVNLPVAPFLQNDLTLVPLRFVSEAAGSLVGWEELTRTITIDSLKTDRVKVIEVIDEQTILISVNDSKVKITLLGIQVNPNMKEKALKEIKQLQGKYIHVSMESGTDPYNRLKGYLFLEDGTFINAIFIARGYGLVEAEEHPWKQLFTILENKAKEANRGVWSYVTPIGDGISQASLQQKVAGLGVTMGNVQMNEYITREVFLHLLLEALFPKFRYVLLAKTVSNVLQNEDVQKIVDYALEKGILAANDLVDGKLEPGKIVTSEDVVKWLERALNLDGGKTSFTLADFGVFEESDMKGREITWGAALTVVEKTKKVYPYLMQYYESLKSTVRNATELQKLGESTGNANVAKEGQDIQTMIALGKFDTKTIDQLSDRVINLGSSLLESIKSGVVQIISKDELKKIQNNLKSDVKKAQDALRNALKANDK
ncbi:stalk domain-containing protein [Paenibacillus periandrae]|uniref:stalk domain-containing protein n=1 Tax=Paenibacillus periandrae TaxID=1761741 RepID=UPI001F08995C|nr:stalk domain-containing protein [Paenibacillus periandrae]